MPVVLPCGNWFALVGRVGDSAPFVIGRSAHERIETSGELICYENDVWLMYFNNMAR